MASDPVKNPTTVAVSMPNANQEYSYVLPINTKRLMFNLRNPGVFLYYSWQSGQVSGPSGNYQTLLPGATRDMEGIQIDNANWTVLYFSTGTPSMVLEIESWT